MAPESRCRAGAIFDQLVRNAFEHGATSVTIFAERQKETLRIIVADNGSGALAGQPRPHLRAVLRPTRRESGGTGMGLQIVQARCSLRMAERST